MTIFGKYLHTRTDLTQSGDEKGLSEVVIFELCCRCSSEKSEEMAVQRPCGRNEVAYLKNLKKPVFLDFRGMGGRERKRESRIRVGEQRRQATLFLMK